MRRLVVTALLAVLAVAAVPSGASAASYGISDQQPTTFTNPLYQPLKLKYARYVSPYDVVSDPVQLQRLATWYVAALSAKQRIVVSFEHSRTAGKEQTLPTVGQYATAMRGFKKTFPKIKEINTWNEVNRCQTGGRTEGQPKGICKAAKGSKVLKGYYGVSRKVFKGSKYKIIPLNVLDEKDPRPAIAYVKAFRKIAKPLPKIWGIHNYSDTNRFSQKRTKKIIKAIGPKGEIWLLETGGQLHLGKKNFGEATAAKALKCMFKIGKIKRIKRAYIYQFNAFAGPQSTESYFDAGLIGPDGTTTRKGYEVVRRHSSKGGC